jgi:hypothetical protein
MNIKKRYMMLHLDSRIYRKFDRIRRSAGHTTWVAAVTDMINRAVDHGRLPKKK